MFDIFQSLIAGAIQGITEFLPISSSGHLVLFHEFFSFSFPDELAFDVVLHVGTLCALLVYFRNDIVKLLRAFFKSFSNWNLKGDSTQRLAWYLAIATIPAVLAGVLLEDIIEATLRNTTVVAVMLIVFGILLYAADTYGKKNKSIGEVSLKASILIGCAQAIALVPGVSRSGVTIITGLSQKLKREAAARFSFLLSIPIVVGAGAKKTIDLFSSSSITSDQYVILLGGFLASAVVGYMCIKYFLKFIQRYSLKVFAYYRIALGIIILILV